MPGTILLDDLHDSITQQLGDYASQLGSAAQQAIQPVPLIPTPQMPQGPDPNAILAELQQHAQDVQAQAQQAAQPALQVLGQGAQAVGGAVTQLGGQAQQAQQQLADQLVQHAQDANDTRQQLQDHAATVLGSTDTAQPAGVQSLAVPKPAPVLGAVTGDQSTPTLGATTGPVDQSQTTTPTTTPPASGFGPIDSSSPSAFAKSFAPYAQYAAQKLGIDPTWVAAMAASESNYGKAGGNELFGIKALPGQPGTSMQTHEGEYGGTNMAQTFASYDSPLDAVNAYVDLLKNHYQGAVGAQDLPTFIHGLKQGGYFTAAEPEYLGIVKGIGDRIGGDVQAGLQGAGQAVGNAASALGTGARAAVDTASTAMNQSQFGDPQLTSDEAYAACGPAAAVRFAERFGRNPTLREATDLAKQVGWTQQSGMAGIASEQKLMTNLGIDTKLVGPDWSAFAKEAQTGNPVTISTSGKNGGHYFMADGYNPDSGAFHVGRSGLDLVGGSEWMTPAQMENLMGPAQGALFANNPTVPAQGADTHSPVTLGGTAGQQNAPLTMGANQPAKAPLNVQDQTPTPIQSAQDVLGQAGQAVGGAASALGTAAQGALGTAQEINRIQPGTEAIKAVTPILGQAQQSAQTALGGAAGAVDQVASDLGQAAQGVVSGAAQTAGGAAQAAPPVLGGVASAVGTTARGTADVLGATASGVGAGAQQAANDLGTAARGAADTTGQTLGGAAATVDQVRQQVQDTINSLPANATVAQARQTIGDTLDALGPRALDIAGDLPLPMGATVSDLTNVGRGVQAGLQTIEEQRQAEISRPDPFKQFQDNVDAARRGDWGAFATGTLALAQRPFEPVMGGSSADLAPSVSSALTAGGIDPNAARVIGQVANLVGPMALERAIPDIVSAASRGADAAVTAGLEAVDRLAPPEIASATTRRAGESADDYLARLSDEAAVQGPATPDVQPAAAPSNPYDLPREAPTADAAPLSSDEVLTHLEQLDQQHTTNDARIAELQNRLAAGPSGRGDFSGTVVRPPWAAGWTNQGLDELARRNGLNPYEANWWERGNFVQGTGEMREDVGQSGIAGSPQYRGTKLTQQSPTAMRAELARLETEQPQLAAAQQAIWDHVGQGGEVYARPSAEGLPFDGGGLDTGAAQTGRGPAAENTPPATASGQAETSVPGASRAPEPAVRAEPVPAELTGFPAPDTVTGVPPVPSREPPPTTAGVSRAVTTVGGAVAGGFAGNATTPEDASPQERATRILLGAGAGAGLASGAAGFRGALPQQVLENLRNAGVVGGGQQSFVPLAKAARGRIAGFSDATKQLMLSNPATHTAYVIGNLLELLRSPAALAMGGRGDDALAGVVGGVRAIPAAADAARAAVSGQSLPTLAHGAALTGGPVYRVLGGVHAFTRTLGEYQGMAQKANQLLRDAGMSANDPGAATYLASQSNQIYDAGLRSGAQSVFMRPNTTAQGGGWLDNMFRTFTNAKEGMLASPDLKTQAGGALLDFGIPFSGIPTQMLNIAANRLPVAAQVSGAMRAVRALRAGDMAGAQEQIGRTGLESAIQLLIAKNIADGNITGADDPDHPDSVRIGGNWVDMKDMGAWALPMRIMASWADGYAKGGQNIPAGTPGQSMPEQIVNAYGPRFAGALNASMKPLAQGVPGENLFSALASLQQGGASQAGLKLAQNAWSRLTVPGAARFAENLSDPVARDIDKKGVDSLWQGTEANWPGLSSFLPAKIDPTTGQPVPKASSGLGIFLGAKNDVASPLTIEADRLNRKMGFTAVTAPKTYPTDVTIQGSKVSLSPDEQRAVTQLTGTTLDKMGQRLNEPAYQNASDPQKALMLKAWINAADNSRTAAVVKVLGPEETRSRIIAGRNVAGQLVDQAQAPTPDEFFSGFNSSSGENILDQRRQRLAGAAA